MRAISVNIPAMIIFFTPPSSPSLGLNADSTSFRMSSLTFRSAHSALNDFDHKDRCFASARAAHNMIQSRPPRARPPARPLTSCRSVSIPRASFALFLRHNELCSYPVRRRARVSGLSRDNRGRISLKQQRIARVGDAHEASLLMGETNNQQQSVKKKFWP